MGIVVLSVSLLFCGLCEEQISHCVVLSGLGLVKEIRVAQLSIGLLLLELLLLY